MSNPVSDPAAAYDAISDAVEGVLVGNDELVRRLTISLLTEGHVLIEGVPGVAKTTAANLFARAVGLNYQRIQMTPDILPADITGTNVYREHTGEFEIQRGPIFSNLVVADEINRATPKTQSALLEAMQERTVTIEGETLALPSPFMVIATQNPIEMEGTFALPEAQRDRFQFKLTVDLPNRENERELVDRFDATPDLAPEQVEPVIDPETVSSLREHVATTYVADPVKEYILDIVNATREDPSIEHGASPRATLAFLKTAKANATLDGRDYVLPSDVKTLADAILSHRLVLSTEAELSDRDPVEVVDDIVADVTPPGAETEFEPAESINADD